MSGVERLLSSHGHYPGPLCPGFLAENFPFVAKRDEIIGDASRPADNSKSKVKRASHLDKQSVSAI